MPGEEERPQTDAKIEICRRVRELCRFITGRKHIPFSVFNDIISIIIKKKFYQKIKRNLNDTILFAVFWRSSNIMRLFGLCKKITFNRASLTRVIYSYETNKRIRNA